MKTRMNLAGMVSVLTWMALLSSSHTASAYYDPGVQRWVNRDPFEELGGINLYTFISNRSVDGVDPNGLSFWSYFKKHAKCKKAMTDWYDKCNAAIPKVCPDDAWGQAEFYSERQEAIRKCMVDSQDMFKKCMEAAYDAPVVSPPFSWKPKPPKSPGD